MKINRIIFILIISLLADSQIVAQNNNFKIDTEIGLSGFVSSSNNPFWFTSNVNGSVGESTNVLFNAKSIAQYKFSETSKLSVGAGFFLRDGVLESFQRSEIYAEYENSFINVVLGSKNPIIRYNGLSSVNDNFTLSGNARAIPGILISAPNPILIFKNVSIDYGLGNYFLNDTRATDNANIHYKKVGFEWQLNSNNSVYGGIEHYAQWGGTSQEFGQQPNSIKDYLDVFLARRASDGTDNDILNALGNHLGFYNLKYNYKNTIGSFQFYHQHPFEDGSGTALKNFPDGIWGIFLDRNSKNDAFFKSFLLEYIHTTSQSGGVFKIGGADNYFSNSIYRSGWTYENNTIGLPFIDPINDKNAIFNNRVKAIHLGATASINKFEFKTKITFARNFGIYSVPFKENAIYSLFQSSYKTEKLGVFSLQIGGDISDSKTDRLGAGLSYNYSF